MVALASRVRGWTTTPYDTFAGVYLPHFVLSSHRVSAAAKILYALLGAGADIRGESLLNPALLAAKMGVAEEAVLNLVDELSNARLIKVSQDPAGTEFLCCHFPPNAWQKNSLPCAENQSQTGPKLAPLLLKLPTTAAEGEATQLFSAHETQTENQAVEGIDGRKSGASRYQKEVCIEYAKARQQAEGKIDNPYALGTALWKSGEGDEEITLWLRAKEASESAA